MSATSLYQKSISKKDLIKDILSFGYLKLNWDGYGAIPLEVETAANAIEFINLLPEKIYSKIEQVYPNPNGTLSCMWSNNFNEEIAIEIGNNTMAYYVQMAKKETFYLNNVFINEEAVNKIVEFINAIII